MGTLAGQGANGAEPSFLCNFKVGRETYYPVSALKFSQFEGLLFDLLGLPNTNVFKPANCLADKIPDAKKLEQLPESSNIFLSDVNVLGSMLETNVFNQCQLKKLTTDGQRAARTPGKAIAKAVNEEVLPTGEQKSVIAFLILNTLLKISTLPNYITNYNNWLKLSITLQIN